MGLEKTIEERTSRYACLLSNKLSNGSHERDERISVFAITDRHEQAATEVSYY